MAWLNLVDILCLRIDAESQVIKRKGCMTTGAGRVQVRGKLLNTFIQST